MKLVLITMLRTKLSEKEAAVEAEAVAAADSIAAAKAGSI